MELLPTHVWLCVTGRWDEARPGLLLAWRKSGKPGEQWEGYVIDGFSFPAGGYNEVRAEQGWHRAEHIRLARRPGKD